MILPIEKFNPSREKIISFAKLLSKDQFTYAEWITLRGMVDSEFERIQDANVLSIDERNFRFGGRYMRGDMPVIKKEEQ